MNIIELDEWIYDKARQSVCEHENIDYDDNNLAFCIDCGKDVTDYQRGDAWVDDERGK